MWGFEVSQKIRFFIWLTSQDPLMTNGNRFIRKLIDDPRCFVCGEIEENTLHILRDCPAASRVWTILGVNVEDLGWRIPLKDWLLGNIERRLVRTDSNWPQLFGVAIWWLWKWRNERCFNGVPKIPLDQVSFIFASLKQVTMAFLRDQQHVGGGSIRRQEILVRWQYPNMGWVRLNTDGASKGNPCKAGAGGLIRGHRGEVFEVFLINCGVC